jgi:virginiamycin B lyase
MKGKFAQLLVAALFASAVLTGAFAASELSAPIKEYDVPTKDAHPHDPALGSDGALWYTEQRADKLGRLDPATGQSTEFRLKAGSGPHGLVSDTDGNIWFTAQGGGYIGKLDPKTGHVTEYKMPDPKARDPHTPVFDQHGILWFTVQGSNFVGRLDPKTGEIKLKAPPTAGALPYGIVISSKGVPFFCEFGTNKLASIDPETMEIREYTLPQKDTRPRRIAVTKDDVLYYTDYARGYLGRYDPKTGKADEFQSPAKGDADPYGIAIAPDGAVWYSESGPDPNTLIRFDPKTSTFAEEKIPSGGGVVRNMVATPDGKLYLACSGVNKVAIVDIR